MLSLITSSFRRGRRPVAASSSALATIAALTMLMAPYSAQALKKSDAAPAPRTNFLASDFLDKSVIYEPTPAAAPATQGDATRVTPSGKAPAVADELAALFPADSRAKMKQIFLECLKQWVPLAAKLGVPADDLGSSTAAFIAGNWMMMNGREVSDEDFLTLSRQMQASLAGHAGFAEAPAADKRKMHEQLVMVGVFMALAREEFKLHPNPQAEANVRETARLNLEQLLGMPAAGLQITAEGLRAQ